MALIRTVPALMTDPGETVRFFQCGRRQHYQVQDWGSDPSRRIKGRD